MNYPECLSPFEPKKWTPDRYQEMERRTLEFHLEHNPTYKKIYRALKRDQQIPYLPISLFKTQGLRWFEGTASATFHSSGTTQAAKSQHHMKDTGVYSTSVSGGFELFLEDIGWVDDQFIFSVVSPPLIHSSLFYMMQVLQGSWGAVGFLVKDTRPETVREFHSLISSNLTEDCDSVLLFGTSLMIHQFLEALMEVPEVHLPPGLLLQTGGPKRMEGEIDIEATTIQLAARLGWNLADCHFEYSMSELSSQMYTKNGLTPGQRPVYYPPPWMKVEVVDPFTQEPVDSGTEGVVAVRDLANVWSCPFIITEDAGILGEDGGLTVLGRVQGALAKGCSLTADQVTGGRE